jgi:FdhD protein
VNVAVVPVPIGRVEGCAAWRADDLLAVEEALEIRLGNRSLTITMRTPGNDFELAAGFLHAEGMVQDFSQILGMGRPSDGSTDVVVVELDGEPRAPVQAQRNFLMTSACGVCGKASLQDLEANTCPILPPDDIQLSPEIIHGLPDSLRSAQSIFDGGLHAAARFDLRGKLECIPVMAAVGAPSSLAVATAERSGITLIGSSAMGDSMCTREVIGLWVSYETSHTGKFSTAPAHAEGSRSRPQPRACGIGH